MYFKHLKKAKQNYFEHLKDSFIYSLLSLKASFYFLIHGLYPDIFETAGSGEINKIYNDIQIKYKKINN